MGGEEIKYDFECYAMMVECGGWNGEGLKSEGQSASYDLVTCQYKPSAFAAPFLSHLVTRLHILSL